MKNEDRFEKLLCVLPDKREDSVSMKELSRRLELSPREVRQFVLDARKVGLPILSDDFGYWKSEDKKELEDYITRRRRVSKTIVSYTRRMKNRAKRRESHNEEK